MQGEFNQARQYRRQYVMRLADRECEIDITHEDGKFVACSRDPDVASDGRTEEDALTNLTEALNLYFDGGAR